MTPLRARLHRIETVDVAGLVAPALNTILRAAGAGEADEAARQTEWWEAALGGPVDEIARQIDVLRGSAGYRSAMLAFAAAQQWRTAGLRHLHLAIVDGSERRYRRWRWSARAYVGTVRRFVAEQARLTGAAATRPRLEAEASGSTLRRHPVHESHFAALRERFDAAGGRTGAEQEHAVERARDLLREVKRAEEERSVLVQRRNAVRQAARAAGATGDPAAGATTVREQVRAYEGALRSREFATERANAAAAGEALAARLREAFATQTSDAFAGYGGEPALLLRLASALPRDAPHTREADPEEPTGTPGESVD
ncbi:MAG TPA: hypothetical protein VF006_27100 [Longimicrobium sp.]